MFVNVGARWTKDHSDIPTKKALKDAFAEDGRKVNLYGTSIHEKEKTDILGDELEMGTKYSVVGPNPYNARKWYATVYRLSDGKVVVK